MVKRRRAVHDHKTPVDGDIFLHSLDEITPEQLGDEPIKRKREGGELVSFIIERSVYFFAVAVFVVCVIQLAATLWDQISGDLYYSSMMEEISISSIMSGNDTPTVRGLQSGASAEPLIVGTSQPDPGITIEMTEYNEAVEELKAEMASLQRRYPDVYAWIYIDDTVIDYPVVRGKDNDYYLNHAFTGEPLGIGSIFADYHLKDYILDNYNTVLYGHNSSTGKMFADVMNYLDENFFMTHNIYVYSSTGLYEFEPFNFSMFDYDFQYFRTQFSGGDDFLSFIDDMTGSTIYRKDMSFNENDHILTLSTCTKTGIKTKRYCLQAKLIKVTE